MTANGVDDRDDDRSLSENAATAAAEVATRQLLAAVKVATPVRVAGGGTKRPGWILRGDDGGDRPFSSWTDFSGCSVSSEKKKKKKPLLERLVMALCSLTVSGGRTGPSAVWQGRL